MTATEILRIALRSLAANKTRSALTMLGIIIGVGSVVTMLAIGLGARTQIEEQIQSLGSNVLMILPEIANDGGVSREVRSRRSITENDALAIQGELATVRAAAATVRGSFLIVAGNRNWWTTVNGTSDAYFVVRDWRLAAGRYFTRGEQVAGDKVAVVGHTVALQLFGGTHAAIDREVRILNSIFKVVGVLADKGPSGIGRDQNDIMFVPLRSARQRLLGGANQINRSAADYILVKVASKDVMANAKDDITRLLRIRHRTPSSGENDFSIADPAAAMEAQNASTRVFSWLLASIASVSLVVGGISIMNIMLVSVTERRREIGLRMAVGARRLHIKLQFLTESIVLCLLGGLIGIVVGIGAAILLAHLAGWPVLLSPSSIVMALLFALVTGVFFGYYPASRAASSEPIDCLRAD